MYKVFSVSTLILLFVFFNTQAFPSILPTALDNAWIYEFKDQSAGLEAPIIVPDVPLSLGELEVFGDFCIRPLVFGDEQLTLYLMNQNEVLALYGFQGSINQQEVGFFFYSGIEPAVYSGITLYGLEDEALLKETKGRQSQLISEKNITLEWNVRPQIVRSNLENSNPSKSYLGTVNSTLSSISEGELHTFEFSLFIGPCQNLGGCYAGTLTFTFLPRVGLTEVRLRGDDELLGGQYDHVYKLLQAPESAFDLVSSENQINYHSCQLEDKESISRSSLGRFANWVNILLIIVIVLRTFKWSYNSISKTTFRNE